MASLAFLLLFFSAVFAMVLARHFHMLKMLHMNFSDTTLYRNMIATNFLPSLDASYISLVIKNLFIFAIAALCITADAEWFIALSRVSHEMPLQAFMGIAVMLSLNVGYRLIKNDNLFRFMLKSCAQESQTTHSAATDAQ